MRAILCAAAAVALVLLGTPARAAGHTATTPVQHFVYLMQGDHTFDNYFGTYPGADGIPAATCVPVDLKDAAKGCVQPYALNGKAPVTLSAGQSVIDRQYDQGKMDGFVDAYERQGRDGAAAMGYYDRRDLPFYWNAADRYELFDRFFAASREGTRPNRSAWVSGTAFDPQQPTIFDRLEAAGVSWKFYVQDYNPKQTFRSVSRTDPATQTVRVPLLNYPRFVDDPQLNQHIVDLDQYYRDLENGTLPAVAYIASSGAGERSARSIPAGQTLVRNLSTQLMLSPYWSSSALLWSYDGSGGWYDHVKPPAGHGFRVPAILVSPYVPRGKVNDTQLDTTSALRFIEQNWSLQPLPGQDTAAGTLSTAFDFTAGPRQAELIPATATAPATAPRVRPSLVYEVYGSAAGFSVLLVVAAVAGVRAPKGALPWAR